MAKSRHRGGAGRTHGRASRARRGQVMPLGKLILLHAVALGLALIIYALPHHVLARREQAVGLRSRRAAVRIAQSSAGSDAAPSSREMNDVFGLEAIDAFGEAPEITGDAASPQDAADESAALAGLPQSTGQTLAAQANLPQDADATGTAQTVSLRDTTDDSTVQTVSLQNVAGKSAAQTPSQGMASSLEMDAALPAAAGAPAPQTTPGPDAADLFGMGIAPEPEVIPEDEREPDPTPEPTPEPVGSFRNKFASRFTSAVFWDSDCYHSPNLDVTIKSGVDPASGARCYVADIYIADITCLRTAFGNDTFGIGNTQWPQDIAKRYGSVVTINGDFYGARREGIVIRNGTLYRNRKNTYDVCAIYWDGTMRVFSPGDFDAKDEINNGCYQAWAFGPKLLDDEGHARTRFNSSVMSRNPRTVIGYFEPGHYCFVAVDGRSESSRGMSMGDLAIFMERLGCVQAYNLDGGKSSIMCAGSNVLNHPYEGGRRCSDVIMILDRVEAG